jgi:hypothetical protein
VQKTAVFCSLFLAIRTLNGIARTAHRPPTRLADPGGMKPGCPTLDTFLFLWQGWGGMNFPGLLGLCNLQRCFLIGGEMH